MLNINRESLSYSNVLIIYDEKNAILTLIDARGTLTQKNRAKISVKGVKTGTGEFSMKLAINWWCDMFSSLKNLGEK